MLLHEDLVRVFELPDECLTQFHFGGGTLVQFLEVDWFNALSPVPSDEYPDPRIDPSRWERVLRDFLKVKHYVKTDKHYLVLCVHHSFTFKGGR